MEQLGIQIPSLQMGLSPNDFLGILRYRQRKFGPFVSRQDVLRLSPRSPVPFEGAAIPWPAVFSQCLEPRRGRAITVQSLSETLFPELLKFLSSDGTVFEWLGMWKSRVSGSRVRWSTGRTLQLDRQIWGEIRNWGFNRYLQPEPVTAEGAISPNAIQRVRDILLDFSPRQQPTLLWREWIGMRAALALPAIAIKKKIPRIGPNHLLLEWKNHCPDFKNRLNATFLADSTPKRRLKPASRIYLPQRLIVAVVMAIALCFFLCLVLLQLTRVTQSAIDGQWAKLTTSHQRAMEELENIVADQASTFRQSVKSDLTTFLAASSAESESTSQQQNQQKLEFAFTASKSNTDALSSLLEEQSGQLVGQYFETATPKDVGMPDFSKTSLSSISAGIAGMFSLEEWEEEKNTIVALMYDASLLGVCCGMILVCATFALMLSTYRQRVADGRRGLYSFALKRLKVAKACNFIGFQIAQTGIAFLLIWLPFSLLWFALLYERSRVFLWEYGKDILPGLLTLGVVLGLLQKVVMDKILTTKQRIAYRRLFSLFEIIFTFLNLFQGILVGAARLFIVLLFFGVNQMRLDISPLPKEASNRDPMTAAYNGMLLLDISNNHPILGTFFELLRRREVKRVQPRAGKLLWLLVFLHRHPELRKSRMY